MRAVAPARTAPRVHGRSTPRRSDSGRSRACPAAYPRVVAKTATPTGRARRGVDRARVVFGLAADDAGEPRAALGAPVGLLALAPLELGLAGASHDDLDLRLGSP